METHVNLSGSRSYTLREALLVYRTDRDFTRNQGETAFVTKHGVALDAEGAPRLQAGTALSESDLQTMIEALRGKLPVEYLPSNVLARTQDTVVWWCAPSVRPMFYARGKSAETDALSGRRFPQPGLVFRARQRSLDIRAVAQPTRPEWNAALSRAPYWNVNDRGSVCLGSSRVPDGVSLDTLKAWEDGFFASEFTHSNAHTALTRYPSGFAGLWTSLVGRETFPVEALADAEQTLAEFIEG